MNSIERVVAAVTFGKPDRTPVIPQIFGHAATVAGVRLGDYVRDGALLARCQIDALRHYGHDAVFAFLDACVETEAVGSAVEFYDEQYTEVARYAFTPETDVSRFQIPDPERAGRMPEVLKAARILRREVGAQVPVVGLVPGPMSLAIQLLGTETALFMAADDPQRFERVLDYAVRVSVRFGEAQLAAGAHLPVLFEPAASTEMVPAMFYREFLSPRIRRMFAAFKRAGSVANWLYVLGAIDGIMPVFPEDGAEIVNLDYVVDAERAGQRLPRTCLNGNLKPLCFVTGTPEAIMAESRRLVRMFAGRGGFILSSGCEIPPESKPANVAAMVAAAKLPGDA